MSDSADSDKSRDELNAPGGAAPAGNDPDDGVEREKPRATPSSGAAPHADNLVPLYLNGSDAEPVWVHKNDLLNACGVEPNPPLPTPPPPPPVGAPVPPTMESRVTQTPKVRKVLAQPPPQKAKSVSEPVKDPIPSCSHSTPISPERKRKKPVPISKKAGSRRRHRSRSRRRNSESESSSQEREEVFEGVFEEVDDRPCVGGVKADRKLKKGDAGIDKHPSFVFSSAEELNIERQAINRRIAAQAVGNSDGLKLFQHFQTDVSSIREQTEDVSRTLVSLRPPDSMLPVLQRMLRTLYNCVSRLESLHGQMDLVFNNKYHHVLQFATSERRNFISDEQQKRFRLLVKDFATSTSFRQDDEASSRNDVGFRRGNRSRGAHHSGGAGGSGGGQRTTSTNPADWTCFACGAKGHKSPNCPNKNKGK